MPTLSEVSRIRLASCHPDLQRLAERAIELTDFAILCGHRGQDEQHVAFLAGTSKLDWPDSRHNSAPSEAMDLAPYPIDWTDTGRFHVMAEIIKAVAREMDIAIEWGGECFHGFVDMPHFQLRRLTR